jgi:hypothetical protein
MRPGVAKIASELRAHRPTLVGNGAASSSAVSDQSNILAKTAKYAIANDRNLMTAIAANRGAGKGLQFRGRSVVRFARQTNVGLSGEIRAATITSTSGWT